MVHPFNGFLYKRAQETRLSGSGLSRRFLNSPSPLGLVASRPDCENATVAIAKLMLCLRLSRHASKEDWIGSQVVSDLSVVVDTRAMKFYIQPRKITKVQSLAQQLLKEIRAGLRWVSDRALRHFCCVCVSLTMPMPWGRFYTR